MNTFSELYSKDVSKYIEKKGKFSYLSWAYAVAELCKIDPLACWEVKRFNGMPFLASECGYFVEVEVTVNGISRSQIHPVLNNNNKPIEKPNSFDINTSIQRCLVKAISLHGLGLFIYAGEDLPEPSEEQKQKAESDRLALIESHTSKLMACETVQELKDAWLLVPKEIQAEANQAKAIRYRQLTQGEQK
jgi:hypothetical protein